MSSALKVEAYEFDPSFEAALVHALVALPKFYSRLMDYIEAEAFNTAPARLLVTAAGACARDTDGVHAGSGQVFQRLRRWVDDGKVTRADVAACLAYFDAVEDDGKTLTEEALLKEVVPILKRRAERTVLDNALSEFQRRGDLSKFAPKLERVARLGETTGSIGVRLGDQSLSQIDRLRGVQRLSTCIMELDAALDGGLIRGTETVLVAASGGGKSIGLATFAAAAAVQGHLVAVPTLELPVPVWTARVMACLSGIPINSILENPYGCGVAEKLDAICSVEHFGQVVVKEFTPKATTFGEIKDWMKELEDEYKREVTVCCVDYADKLRARGLSERAQENSYQSAGGVYEEIYTWARDHRRWAITGSQARRSSDKGKQKKLDSDDVADSLHKIRTADYAFTLNPRDEGESLLWHFAKVRLGKSGGSVGPLPCDFATGRIGPVSFFDNGLWDHYDTILKLLNAEQLLGGA